MRYESALSALVVAAGLAVAGEPSLGIEIVYPVGAESWDLLGAPDNDSRIVDLAGWLGRPEGTPVTIIGLGWDLSISAYFASWISELNIGFSDATQPGAGDPPMVLTPGGGNKFPGDFDAVSDGITLFADIDGAPDVVLSEGVLRLEFFESFDDEEGAIDGILSGSVVILVEGEGADSCGVADLAPPLGQMDATDITRFVGAFASTDPVADMALPVGVYDLADIVVFLESFTGPCP